MKNYIQIPIYGLRAVKERVESYPSSVYRTRAPWCDTRKQAKGGAR